MTIDISKIKPGDKVTLVPLEVTRITGFGNVAIKDGDREDAYFRTDQIAAHHPAPREIVVGDRVRQKWAHVTGEVLMVDAGYAFIAWPNGERGSREVSDLTLVEGDQ
jgi:hypothetical protein